MKITFGPRGLLMIDDANLIFRNFKGAGDKYNRKGDRNFSVIINDQEIADALVKEGWNIKIKESNEEGAAPMMRLPVKIKYGEDGRGPNAYLKSGKSMIRLTEETIGMLDDINILSVNMDLRPYDWEVDGKTGRTAYLNSISVTQAVDRFDEEYERYLNNA